jgi:hypothetical protein
LSPCVKCMRVSARQEAIALIPRWTQVFARGGAGEEEQQPGRPGELHKQTSPSSRVRDAPTCSSPGCSRATLACRDEGEVRSRPATVLRLCVCMVLCRWGARIFCPLLTSFRRCLPSDPNIMEGAGKMHKRPGAVRVDGSRLGGEDVAPGPPPWRAAEDGRGSHGRREPGRLTRTRWGRGRCGARGRRERQRPTPWGLRRRRLPSPRAMSRRAFPSRRGCTADPWPPRVGFPPQLRLETTQSRGTGKRVRSGVIRWKKRTYTFQAACRRATSLPSDGANRMRRSCLVGRCMSLV